MTVDQVVERYPKLRRSELLAAMRTGALRHWPKGRLRLTTEQWIVDWIKPQLRGGESGGTGESISSGTADSKHECDPTGHRTTPQAEEIAAKFLVQSNLRKARKPAPRAQ